MSQTTRLSYDLSGLRELRANNWEPDSSWITLTATDSEGRKVSLVTNGAGEGEFTQDCLHQTAGTCDFSIRGWSDRKARAELRRRYDEMMERRALDADLVRFEREFDAECGEGG